MLYEPSTRFAYAGPEKHRQALSVSADERFLRARGVRPPDVRDEWRMLDR
jgi:hypothetical protein